MKEVDKGDESSLIKCLLLQRGMHFMIHKVRRKADTSVFVASTVPGCCLNWGGGTSELGVGLFTFCSGPNTLET